LTVYNPEDRKRRARTHLADKVTWFGDYPVLNAFEAVQVGRE
jgi:hypothetical protein